MKRNKFAGIRRSKSRTNAEYLNKLSVLKRTLALKSYKNINSEFPKELKIANVMLQLDRYRGMYSMYTPAGYAARSSLVQTIVERRN